MHSVLLLNAAFEPLTFCAERRALTLMAKGRVFVVEEDDHIVHRDFKRPVVVRLKDYTFIPVKRCELSRKNILLRDRFQCAYCGHKFHPSKLTLDHIMPRSRGGKDSWINLISSCGDCNRKKADRTPEEAEMPLLFRPLPATVHTSRFLLRRMGAEDPRHRKYLYFESNAKYETVH